MICPEFVICEAGLWCRHAKPHAFWASQNNQCKINDGHGMHRLENVYGETLCPGCIELE